MAAYTAVDWSSSVTELPAVLAEIEVKLETLDSTSNTIMMDGIERVGHAKFQAYIIYTG